MRCSVQIVVGGRSWPPSWGRTSAGLFTQAMDTSAPLIWEFWALTHPLYSLAATRVMRVLCWLVTVVLRVLRVLLRLVTVVLMWLRVALRLLSCAPRPYTVGRGRREMTLTFEQTILAYRRALQDLQGTLLTFLLTFDAAPLGISHGCPGQHVFLVQIHKSSYMVRAWTSAAVFGPTGEGGGGGAFRLTG